MSEPQAASAAQKPSMQDYEKTLAQSAADVASFDAGDQSLL